jgi:AcrR family transcriptional regulator
MARIVNEKEYAERRNEILDAAQRLIYTKGYEQMAIQDLLNTLGISKGAFYHYFDSKQALLEALIERIRQEAEQIILPIVQDYNRPALEKFLHIFSMVARWKTAQKDYLLALFRIWYTDHNALVRQKVTSMMLQWATPLFGQVIRQGIQEGVFSAVYPDQLADVVMTLMLGMGETMGRLILGFDASRGDFSGLANTVSAYTQAMERVLGAPSGSLILMDADTLRKWTLPVENQAQDNSLLNVLQK